MTDTPQSSTIYPTWSSTSEISNSDVEYIGTVVGTSSSATRRTGEKDKMTIVAIRRYLTKIKKKFETSVERVLVQEEDSDTDDAGPSKRMKLTDEEVVATLSDTEVFARDIPERMQTRSTPVVPALKEELTEEIEWIFKNAFVSTTISVQNSHLTEAGKEYARKSLDTVYKIRYVLELIRNYHLEVPAIAFNKKEYFLPDLNMTELWKIYKYDDKWCLLQKRKEDLYELFMKLKTYQESKTASAKFTKLKLDEDMIKKLEKAQSMEELDDYYQYFILHYGSEILPDRDDFTSKYSVSAYAAYRETGLSEYIRLFGLTSAKFAVNVSKGFRLYECEQCKDSPHSPAFAYMGNKFPMVARVIEAAKFMVAMQIAKEPVVRRLVRREYTRSATVSVLATQKGFTAIKENHPVYTMKYLKDKPVSTLVGDEYLRLALAQEQRLITINFNNSIGESYLEHMQQLFYRSDSSMYVQNWNILRAHSVKMAIETLIIPDLKKELHSKLLREAKDCVMRCCARKMYNWIKPRPYRCPTFSSEIELDPEWYPLYGIRIMAVSYANEDKCSDSYACIIESDAEVKSHLSLPNLMNLVSGAWDNKLDDVIKVWIASQKPHVIVVSGDSCDAMVIAQKFRDITASLTVEQNFPNIDVEIVENELAVVYGSSRQGCLDFPSYSEVLRRAISLGRRFQDPLFEFAHLCNDNHEILQLNFHNMQSYFPKKELLENISVEFINRVNEVGVDINRAVRLPYFRNVLQFVSGLGPRKARYFFEFLETSNVKLASRSELEMLGKKVFANCASFVKIDAYNKSTFYNTQVELLDTTRVHPQYYDVARSLASKVLNEEPYSVNSIIKLVGCPSLINERDLVDLMKFYLLMGYGDTSISLYDIRSELVAGYKDLRPEYVSPTPDKLLEMFIKEPPSDFYVGKLVKATVTWLDVSAAWIHLDNGILGFINFENLSDELVVDPTQLVSIGVNINCRVVRIMTSDFYIEASCKNSDILDANLQWSLPNDLYYDYNSEIADLAKHKKMLEERREKNLEVKKSHRCFKDVTFSEAENLMATMHRGNVIIRPSSTKPGYYSFSWKVTDGVYQYFSVRDDINTSDSLTSTSLWIGKEEFQDFDHIIDSYIKPRAGLASQVIRSKFFHSMIMDDKETVEEILVEYKKHHPRAINYVLTASKINPGTFMISYLWRDEPYHSHFFVTSHGLQHEDMVFMDLNYLIKWFKENKLKPVIKIVLKEQ